MRQLLQKVLNHRVGNDKLDWDNRNLRIMNAMSLMLTICLLIFSVIAISLGQYKTLPLTLTGVALSINFFIIPNNMGLGFMKFYWCIVPSVLSFTYALMVVGSEGNDKYYLMICSLLPLIVFKNRWTFLAIVWLNMLAFFSLQYLQTIVEPWSSLSSEQLFYYVSINELLFFTFLFAMFMLFKKENNGYQEEIELQKELIEEQSLEVRQSIEYAKRIQEAILPPKRFIEQHLPNSFVLYKPKDIVAGDFYWMEKSDNILLFACADCTGHGVPGAMVSVVCCNALNRAVNEFGLKSPAEILDKTRELVIETFEKSDHEVKDGMDISLCALDQDSGKLSFAGANNGLYHLKNGELIETKADKQPVGNFAQNKPFTNKLINVEKGDAIYLFTDGFADQFGGDKGKKYKYKAFKQFIVNLQSTPIQSHGKAIEEEFDRWKGDLEQIDDVCILGVQF